MLRPRCFSWKQPWGRPSRASRAPAPLSSIAPGSCLSRHTDTGVRACIHTCTHTHTHTHTHRFAPVKTCADLLRVRSDAYEVTDDFRLVLSPDCKGSPPVVDLDKKVYKKVAGLEKMLEKGELPSLKHCSKLAVKGKVVLSPGTVFKGKVSVVNAGDDWKELPAGTYEDQDISL